jgi:ADP-heptose:LPS heptosyltransferase
MNGGTGGKARSILVFRIGQLGDTLVSLPTVSVIRKRHPGHRLVLLTETQPSESGYVSSWDVLGPTNWFDEVMFYTPTRNPALRILTMFSLAQRIRALRPAMIYDLAPERTARQSRRDRFFFEKLAGVKDYHGGGFLLKPPKDAHGSLPRIAPEWRRLLGLIDAKAEDGYFRLQIPESEMQRARALLLHEGLKMDTRVLAVGPGSKMPSKVWSLERFREMGERLLSILPDIHLLVVGGKEDAVIGRTLCDAWGQRAHNLAGRLSIYESAAVLQRCLAYAGNDTGAMHLAAMVGVSCVALFSARDYPGQWEPYGEGHVILRHETECAGCMRTICPYDNKCLNLISVDEAERAVRNVITAH